MVIATAYDEDALDKYITIINGFRSTMSENINAQHFPASLPRIYNTFNIFYHEMIAFPSRILGEAYTIDEIFYHRILPSLPLKKRKTKKLQGFIDEYERKVRHFELELTSKLKTFVLELMETCIHDIGRMDIEVEQAASTRRGILQNNLLRRDELMELWGRTENGIVRELENILFNVIGKAPGGEDVPRALDWAKRCGDTEDWMEVVNQALVLRFQYEIDQFARWLRAVHHYLTAINKEILLDEDGGGGYRNLSHFVEVYYPPRA